MSFEAMAWAVEQDLPAMEKIVLLMLANRTNKDTGRCDPSLDRMASDCGMSRASVKRQMKSLMDRGLIAVHHRRFGEVNLPNQYSLNLGGRVTQTPLGSEMTEGRVTQTPGVGSHRPPNLEDKPGREPVIKNIGDFDAFWAEVPRKVGRGAAEKSYRAALKKTDHGTLIAGIRRYAEERAGKDRQYTVHPATWLNQERWADEPERSDDFHNQIDALLRGNTNELRREDAIDHGPRQPLLGGLEAPRTPDDGNRNGPSQGHGGSYQQEVASLIRTRKFG